MTNQRTIRAAFDGHIWSAILRDLGYGTRDGNQIKFVFEYPDGPFHNTYLWNADEKSWQWLMEQKDKDGKWVPFANLKLTKLSK